jgi:1,4-dihydroxy-6-naphthoate synthase
MQLSFAYSPCPNDTFSFGAAVHGLVDTEGVTLIPQLADIKELNQLARLGTPDVCKVSFFAWYFLRETYALLESGAALGFGVGPLIVANRPMTRADLATARIAVPGLDTTAHLLLQFYAPEAQHREVLLFSEIMPAVVSGEFDAGVIIHESRFVYKEHGLHLVQDLGQYWETQTSHPIPLGGIVAKASLGPEVHAKLSRVLQRSVLFAQQYPEQVMDYVRAHAQEMAPSVQQQHIELYVNTYTRALGTDGHHAINRLLAVAEQLAEIAQ